MNSETISVQPVVCRPRRIGSRGEQRLLHNIRRDQKVATAKKTNGYNSDDPDSVSGLTVQIPLLSMGITQPIT